MIVDKLILDKKASKSKYDSDKKSEKPLRSVAKAISWRIVGTVDTLIISYLLTGTFTIAASIASVDFITKMFLYFFHERIWNKINWGK